MRLVLRFSLVLLVFAGWILLPALPAAAAANHVVISEYGTRGPAGATDEFVELYNPTESAISLSGWKLQYKSASGSSWSDRATLPANASIAAHGYFLITSTSYVGSPTADFNSAAWGSGQGMADAGGHEHVINASSVEIDKVGWGTAIDPEGGVAAPTSLISVERKALPTSTAALLFTGGAHALLGNGEDTDNNGSNFVEQTNGRNPQNTASPPEPSISAGGNGTGLVAVTPAGVNSSTAVPGLRFTCVQDSAYTIATIKIAVPTSWTWSHNAASVTLTGPAFASAAASVAGDSVIVTGAALTQADSGSVTIANLTSAASKGIYAFNTLTAIASGTPTQIVNHPRVRVIELVPIVSVHVNNAAGVPTSPYGIGAEATVTGVVTANLNDTRTDLYLQDGTAGINLFSFTLPSFTVSPGDSLTVTGSILQFRGLTELSPDFALFTRHATGRPIPAPMVLTCAQVNATFQGDFTEPNEGRLIRINGVSYNSSASLITDASGTTMIFIPSSFPPAPSVFDVIGVLKQFKPGATDPGPPYTTGYEISPRTPADILPLPGPQIVTTPFEDDIQPASVRLNWLTDIPGSSVVRYGLTTTLTDSLVDPAQVTTHAPTVSGLSPATAYYYSVGSANGSGSNFSPTQLFSTASPPASTGQIKVYFSKSVNTSLAAYQPAIGNQTLHLNLIPHIQNAKRSIDVALYSLSGGVGTTVASALVDAKNRGVKVRVICEDDNGSAAFTSLANSGIPLITDAYDFVNAGAGLMHNKFFVIDARGGAPESVWVWTGSWNATDPGTLDDYQNALEIQDVSLANAYMMEFNEMWGSTTDTPNSGNSRFGNRKLDNTPHRFSIGGRDIECYFSPSDGVTSKIISLIDGAEHSIGFQLLTLTQNSIGPALIAAHNAGIEVRGDFDNGTDSGSEYTNLVNAGVDVRLKTGGGGLLHHKYMIVDAESEGLNSVTLTGSHNWSAAAENSNSENTLVIRDFNITNQYLQEFAARYYQFGGTDSVFVDVDALGGNPRAVSLSQNFPNPVRGGRTSIFYAIPVAQDVALRLFDLQGREVKSLVNQRQEPGRYRVDLETRGLTSGVYFYRLETAAAVRQNKLLILK